jgi:CRP/FNR family cyclic AMP-dependent transcriptional regulator
MTCLCEQIAGNDMDLSPTCIGHLWIFQNLDQRKLKRSAVRRCGKNQTTGQALFLQGDPADEMFLIKGGRVKLSKVLEDGTELTLDIRKAGDFVGENMFSEEGNTRSVPTAWKTP